MGTVPLAIVLDFDGVAYRGDLAVQAYARRVAENLEPAAATTVIGGMRAFLEGKPRPDGMPAEFDTAEDGFELVIAMADAAGLSAAQRQRAYLESRDDMARSAFALDPEPGLVGWLTGIDEPHTTWLVTNAPMNGLREVLESVGLLPLIDEILPSAGKPAGLRAIAERALAAVGAPSRLVAIGDRWAADLAGVAAVGGRTAHVDRFDRGFGTPTWRSTELEPLLPALIGWAADPEGYLDV